MKHFRIITLIIALFAFAAAASAQESEEVKKKILEDLSSSSWRYNDGQLVTSRISFEEYDEKNRLYKYYFFVNDDVNEGRIAVYDNDGNRLLAPIYSSYALASSCDLAIFGIKDGNIGYKTVSQRVDRKSPRFFGVVDSKGNEVLPCRYSTVQIESGVPIAVVAEGEKYEYDKDGHGWHEKLLSNGKWGVYDLENKQMIVPCKYEYIAVHDIPFCGIAVYPGMYTQSRDRFTGYGYLQFNVGGKRKDEFERPKGGKWGLLDIYGNTVLEPVYDDITLLEDGNYQVLKGKEIAILNAYGKPVGGGGGGELNEVDDNIPSAATPGAAENTFAFVIGNERYAGGGADYSINDAKVFAEYCRKTLALPEKNIRYYEDITYGNLNNALGSVADIADVYEGDATIIFYFSGLGYTGDDRRKYILPVDAELSQIAKTSTALDDLLAEFAKLPAKMTVCIVDAPFDGNDKADKSMQSGRAAVIKKNAVAPANVVLLHSGERTFSDADYSHSLFTYGLLDALRKSRGACTVADWAAEAQRWAKKVSLDKYQKTQDPVVAVPQECSAATLK